MRSYRHKRRVESQESERATRRQDGGEGHNALCTAVAGVAAAAVVGDEDGGGL